MKKIVIDWENADNGIIMYWREAPASLRAILRWQNTPLGNLNEEESETIQDAEDPWAAAGMGSDFYGYMALKRAVCSALKSAGIDPELVVWPYEDDDLPDEAFIEAPVDIEIFRDDIIEWIEG